MLAARNQASADGAIVKEVILALGAHGFGFRLDLTNNTVLGVEADSPSSAGGLKTGDVILAVNDEWLSECRPLHAMIDEVKDTRAKLVEQQLRNGGDMHALRPLSITLVVRRPYDL